MLGYDNMKNGGCSSTITSSDCNYTPQGINAAFGYNTAAEIAQDVNCACADNQEMCCAEKRERRQEMLNNIRCLNFAIVELAQYLDTHPDDRKALCLHREYCQQYKDLTDSYQKVYGPLTIHFPCNKWRWLEEPWASFNLGIKYHILLLILRIGVPYEDDLYLDIVIVPDGRVHVLDEDELLEAYHKGVITEEDYNLAYKTKDFIFEKFVYNIEELTKMTKKYLY